MKIELTRGLSYAGHGVVIKDNKPITVDDEVGSKLLETGRFREVATMTLTSDFSKTDFVLNPPAEEATNYFKMKTAELQALAAEKNIDISGCKNNTERAQTILDALEAAEAIEEGIPAEEATNTIGLDELSAMDGAQLATLANTLGVDISGCKNDAEKVSAIYVAQGSSITMTDLQTEGGQ